MTFIKRAFLEGLQRSLVSSGAIPPYSSKWQAKHALDQAEAKQNVRDKEEEEAKKLKDKMQGKKTEETQKDIQEKDPTELTEDQVSEMMTDIVSAEPLDEAIEALKEYQEAAGDSEMASEELAAALEDVQDSKEAAIAIRRLKAAAEDPAALQSPNDFQEGEGDPDAMPNLMLNQVAPETLVAPNKGDSVQTMARALKDVTSGGGNSKSAPKAEEVKAAMEILRKLASGMEMQADHLQQDVPDLQVGNANPPANTVDTDELASQPSAVVMPHPSAQQGDMVNLAHLVAKTAQEVGHFLPNGLSSTDKLAALRTMVGMNGRERAEYIGRIKQAMHTPEYTQHGQEQDASRVLNTLGL